MISCLMPQRSRVTLFNDISGDIITTALRGADEGPATRCFRPSAHAKRRMIESDLAAGSRCQHPGDRGCPTHHRPGSDPAGRT
jgi:flagellar motor switch protein FliG